MIDISSFSLFDYIIIVIASISLIFSFLKGFIQSFLGLLTWIGAVIITLIFYENLTIFLTTYLNRISFLEQSGLSIIISTVLSIPFIFLSSLIILKKIRTLISSDYQKSSLGNFLDKIFGIIYGLIFGVLIISIILITINNLSVNFEKTNFIKKSILYPHLKIFIENYIIKYSPMILNETNQIIDENTSN